MRELPSGWATVALGDVARIDAKLVDPMAFPDSPHIAPNHIEGDTGRLLPFRTVKEDGVTSPKYAFSKGDVLYTKIRPYLAKVTVAPFDGLCSADMYPLATDQDPRFLAYWLVSPMFTALAANHQGRSVLPKINRAALFKLPVPLPDLAEQERIVAAIEEQFSRLEAAEESLRRVSRNLDRHRSATLLSVASGPWDVRPLGDILVSLRNGVFVSRPSPDPPGTPIFRISAVRPMSLDVDDVRFAPSDTDTAGAYVVHEGDLLLTRYSGNASYVGACALVPRLARPTLHPDKLIRAVVDRSAADPAYLELALSVGPSQREIAKRRKTTAGQVGIAGSQLRTVPVGLPPLEIQRRIVEELSGPRSLWVALSRDLLSARERMDRLRSVILREAFAGRLMAPASPGSPQVEVVM